MEDNQIVAVDRMALSADASLADAVEHWQSLGRERDLPMALADDVVSGVDEQALSPMRLGR